MLAQNKTTIQTYTSGMGLNDAQKNVVVGKDLEFCALHASLIIF